MAGRVHEKRIDQFPLADIFEQARILVNITYCCSNS